MFQHRNVDKRFKLTKKATYKVAKLVPIHKYTWYIYELSYKMTKKRVKIL